MADSTKPLILCVDDERPVLGLLKGWLAGEGYDVLTSDGGEKALLALTSAKPDLILLDVVMPDMDGHALCVPNRSVRDCIGRAARLILQDSPASSGPRSLGRKPVRPQQSLRLGTAGRPQSVRRSRQASLSADHRAGHDWDDVPERRDRQ